MHTTPTSRRSDGPGPMASRILLASAATLALAGCEQIEDLLAGSTEQAETVEIIATEGSGATAEEVTFEVSAQPEVEPNDTVAMATRLGFERPVTGTASGDDVDVFVLPSGVHPAVVTLEADGAWQVVATQDRTGASWTRTGSGDVTLGPIGRREAVQLSLSGEVGTYIVRAVAREDLTHGFIAEPDTVDAPGLTFGSLPVRVVEMVEAAQDQDTFAIDWSALSGLDAVAVELVPRGDVALNLEVVDADGMRVAFVMAGETGAVRIPNLRRPSAPGAMRLVVSRADDGTSPVDYELRVQEVAAGPTPMELEPNDSGELAWPLPAATPTTGYMHHRGDVDFFVVAPELGPVAIEVDPPAGMDLLIVADTPDQVGEARTDLAPAGEAERFCAIGARTQPFYARVEASTLEGEGLGVYTITAQPLGGPGYEAEPNDARPIAPAPDGLEPRLGTVLWSAATFRDVTATGHIYPARDVDRYVLEVIPTLPTDTGFRHVTVRLTPGAALDLAMELDDGEGGQLGRADAGRVGEGEVLEVDLPPGRYGLTVAATSDDQAGCEAPYHLEVTEVRTTPVVPRPVMPQPGQVQPSDPNSPRDPGRLVDPTPDRPRRPADVTTPRLPPLPTPGPR